MMTPSSAYAQLFRSPRRRPIRKSPRPALRGLEKLEDRLAPAAAPVQFFYSPLPADAMRTTLDTLNSQVGDDLTSVTSLSATVDGTVIYYDEWEDGYEANLGTPTKATTQIWGDNDPSNGIAPGYVTDIINAGAVITLRNDVPANPRDSKQFYFDGGDRIGASQTLAMTRAGWGVFPGTVLAGAVEVYDTRFYGTSFTAPVGTNVASGLQLFEYAAVYVQASQDNTQVQIDWDGDGTADVTQMLNQGKTYVSPATVLAGTHITADKPVQVQLATGDINDSYESRWFTLFDDSRLSSDYFSPVGTVKAANPVSIFVHNPNAADISVNYETQTTTGNFVVTAGSTYQFNVLSATATHLFTPGGEVFSAVGANDVQTTAAGSRTFDWGFSLQPLSSLSPIAVVGWGPGSGNTPPGQNYSPVWVTVERATTLYVDYDGDPGTGTFTDPRGNQYDVTFNLARLQSQRVFDPDHNQTGMRLYTLDGTLISAAWGEDPSVAVDGTPALDLGTTIPAFPVPLFDKSAALAPGGDANGDGLINSGDTVRYTLTIRNLGLYPVINSVVGDTLPTEVTYVANSAFLNDGFSISSVPDSGATAFPLDEGGFTITNINVGGTTRISFDVTINKGLASGTVTVTNVGTLSFGLVFNQDSVDSPIRAALGDRFWDDLNGDGVQDPGEPGIGNVTLDLYRDINSDGVQNAGDTFVRTVTTNGAGGYNFIDLDEGDYVIVVTDTNGMLGGGKQTAGKTAFAVIPGEVIDTADFGYNFNLLPNAIDDGPIATPEDTPVTTGNVLGNDNLGDLPTTITAFDATSANGGTVLNNGNGTFTYTPPTNFNGTDTFTYTITDANGDSDTATVTINVGAVNDPPVVAGPLPDRTNFDSDPVNIDVSAPFSDPENDPLTFSATGLPLGLSIDPTTGVISGTLNRRASQSGPYAVTIMADDGNGGTVSASFTWTVANPQPTATDNTNSVQEDVTLAASGNVITDNNTFGIDNDPDGDPLTVSAVNGVAGNVGSPVTGTYGSVTIGANGSYTYSLNNASPLVQALAAGQTVTDSFDYTIADGDGGFDTARLTITITGTNDAPVVGGPIPDQTNLDSDSVTVDVSGPFSDPDGDPLTYGATGLPLGLSIDPNTGVITGTIDRRASQSGPYSVTITADDGNGGTVSANFTWNVTNPVPTATDNTNAVQEDVTPTASGNVITDNDSFGIDSDPDGDPLSVSAVNGNAATVGVSISGTYGSVTIAADGSYTYTLNNADPTVQAHAASQSVTDSFDYTITDGDGGFASARLIITINGTNDAPTTVGLPDQTNFDRDTVSVDVHNAFSDVDGGPLTFSVTGLPPGLTIDPATGVISGTIPPGASAGGPYTVDITADDGNGGTVTATFVWTVNPLSTLAGFAYSDLNNDGAFGGTDTPITGVTITLTGTDDRGAVSLQVTSAADGSYSFTDLRPGTYSISETQPGGWLDGKDAIGTAGGNLANDQFTNITLAIGGNGADYNFGELAAASLSGVVFNDANNDGVQNGPDTGIAGVSVSLTGTDDLGAAVSLATTTDATGAYTFGNLRPGTYAISEVQPSTLLDGTETVGTQGGATAMNDIIDLTLTAGTDGTGNAFAELSPARVTGLVFNDFNNNGVQDPGEPGIQGVTITLTGTDDRGAVSLTTTTDANGNYGFDNLRPGTYRVTETQPVGYSQGTNSAPAGTVNGDDMDFTVNAGDIVAGNMFADRRPATIAGVVWYDVHRDGRRQAVDPAQAGVTITLTGTDIGGNPITRTITTAADGTFLFTDLPPGTYTLTESFPAGFAAGVITAGTNGGAVGAPAISNIVLGAFDQAQNYDFAQIRALPAVRGKRNFLGATNLAALGIAQAGALAVQAAAPAAPVFGLTPWLRRFTFSAMSGLVKI